MGSKFFSRIIFSVTFLFPFCSLSMKRGKVRNNYEEEVLNSVRDFDGALNDIDEIFENPLRIFNEKDEDASDLTSESSLPESDEVSEDLDMKYTQKTSCLESLAQLSLKIKLLFLPRKK